VRLLLYTAETVPEDLALEEAIQLGLEEGVSPPTLRIWQPSQHAVVVGTGQEAAREVNLVSAREAGVPVLRRHSGGGAVLIGPGILNYSAFHRIAELPGASTIGGAMRAAIEPVRQALARLGVTTLEAGLSDLAAPAPDGSLRKIAGHAQARKRLSVLVHGTLLADPDWRLIEQLLAFPSRAPDYRAGRTHRQFLISLRELGAGWDPHALAAALAAVLGKQAQEEPEPLPAELAKARQLAGTKYARDRWNLRR
jgi:lipoate-protein ligase A